MRRRLAINATTSQLVLSRCCPPGLLQLPTDVVTVEPCTLKRSLVAAEALAKRELHIAFELPPARHEMVLARPRARAQHGGARPRRPYPLVDEQGGVEIIPVTGDRGCKHAPVLDRHRAALAKIRQHGVRGITEQRQTPLAPSWGRLAIIERPFVPARAAGEEPQQVGMPAGVGRR